MNTLVPVIAFCLFASTGCSLLGYELHKRAERAPVEEAEKIQFLDSYEGATQLTAPMVRALSAALHDFIPPGSEPASKEDLVAHCLSQLDTFAISVFQASEDLFFVRFSAVNLHACAPDRIVLDAGAVYAVDGRGRILAVQP